MNLRILASRWDPFVEALRAREDVETAGVILAERLAGGVLLARELHLVPDDGYQIRRVDQLRIDPVAINRMVRPARDKGWSVFTVHTHPGTDSPWFSAADDAGDARLMPAFLAQTSGPHGSLVVAGTTGTAVGRVWHGPGEPSPLPLRIVGRQVRSFAPEDRPEPGSWFDRQRLALGEHGHAILRDLHVGIVGLGGTGSATLTQLAHAGIGRLTVVDGDLVEASNVSRIVGATAEDAGLTWKVDVAQRYSRQLGLGGEVRALRGHVGTGVLPRELESCDVIFSCVDGHSPRALLNRLAYARGIPTIDMGTAFRVDRTGLVVGAAGRVVIIGPGRPCLACWGHIDPQRLRVEALSTEDRAFEAAEGYIQGADVAQPSVIAFNTTVSGAAVVEFLRLVAGFADADPPLRLSFDFMTGAVRRNRLAVSVACTICGAEEPRGT